jgi:hypothetical protein
MVNDKSNAVFLNRLAAHLAAPVRRMNNFRSSLLIDPALVNDPEAITAISVQSYSSLLAVYSLSQTLLLDDKPLLEFSLSPIKVRLVFGTETLPFEFLPDLASRDSARETLHHFYNPQMNGSRLAGRLRHTRSEYDGAVLYRAEEVLLAHRHSAVTIPHQEDGEPLMSRPLGFAPAFPILPAAPL